MTNFVSDRLGQIFFATWQHVSLVIQCLALATLPSLLVGPMAYRGRSPVSGANPVSAIGLTLPPIAPIGLLVAPFGFGVARAVIVTTSCAALSTLRNTVVGMGSITPTVVESARGTGMSRMGALLRVEPPLAWLVT